MKTVGQIGNEAKRLRKYGVYDLVDGLKSALRENLRAVVLTGSVARGEETDESDIDVWIVLGDLDVAVLGSVRSCIETAGVSKRIEPECITWDELAHDAFKRGFSPVQCYLDGIVLYGELPPEELCSREDIRNECVQVLTFLLMCVRSIVAGGRQNGFEVLKSNPYLTKPLVWALAYEVYLRTGTYYQSRKDLLSGLTDEIERHVVLFVESGFSDVWLEEIGDSRTILEVLHNCVHNVLTRAQGISM